MPLVKGKAASSKDGAKPPEEAPGGDETDDDYFDIIEELGQEDPEEWDFAVRSPSRDLKSEALSTEHLLCHKPLNPYCQICRNVRIRNKQHRRKKVPTRTKLDHFGQLVTTDHLIAEGDHNQSSDGHQYG